jgi:hypothetical protein
LDFGLWGTPCRNFKQRSTIPWWSAWSTVGTYPGSHPPAARLCRKRSPSTFGTSLCLCCACACAWMGRYISTSAPSLAYGTNCGSQSGSICMLFILRLCSIFRLRACVRRISIACAAGGLPHIFPNKDSVDAKCDRRGLSALTMTMQLPNQGQFALLARGSRILHRLTLQYSTWHIVHST